MIDLLVVDDDAAYRRLVELALEDMTVRLAPTVAAAVAAVSDRLPDVIVCDLHLPDAAGEDGIRLLMAAAPQTSVLATSATDGPEASAALAVGAHDFLLKGGEIDGTMAGAIRVAARRSAGMRGGRRRPAGGAQAADSAGDGIAWPALVDAAPAGVFFTDGQGACCWANARFHALTGLAGAGANGRRWMEAIHPSDRRQAVARFNQGIAASLPFKLRLRFRRPDHDVVEADLTANPASVGTGATASWVIIVVDQTAQRAVARALTASRARLRELIRASASVIMFTDLDGRFLTANPAAEAIFEHPLEEIIGRTRTELLGSERAAHDAELDRAVLESGEARQHEFTVTRPDGSPRTWLTERFPVRDDAGIITGVGTVATDITERRRLEREVERQYRLLQQAQDVAGVALWSFDPEHQELQSTTALTAIYDVPDFSGSGVDAAIGAALDPVDSARVQALFVHSQTHPGDYDMRVRSQPGDGPPRMLHVWWRSAPDGDGRISIVGATQDITQELHRERAQREVGSRLRLGFDSASVGLGLADAEGRWTRVNAATCALVGRRADALLGTPIDEIIHPDDRALDAERLRLILRGELDYYTAQRRCLRPDGELRVISLLVYGVRINAAVLDHLMVQMHDVTERRAHEDRVRETGRETV